MSISQNQFKNTNIYGSFKVKDNAGILGTGIGSQVASFDISGNGIFRGADISFNSLPKCSETPTIATQLITKAYGDATYTSVDIRALPNVWTNTNAFNTYLPTSTLTPSGSTDLITKTYADTALNLKADLASPTFTGTVSGITQSMVGLANVDNTSDVNKPVSTAQQTALNLKANIASPTFTGTVLGITQSMVGLANVDNTSDVNKPVSTAQQTALNLKADLASPTFTGIPTCPTATLSTNTTQIASTAFVLANAGSLSITASYLTSQTMTSAQSGGYFSLGGTTGFTISLPNASGNNGVRYTFINTRADTAVDISFASLGGFFDGFTSITGRLSGTTSFQLVSGSSQTFVSNNSKWYLQNGSCNDIRSNSIKCYGGMEIIDATTNTGSNVSGSLFIRHLTSGGSSSIVFQSASNSSNDYGFIQFQDNITTGVGETNRLTIGTNNDGDDDLILAPSGTVRSDKNVSFTQTTVLNVLSMTGYITGKVQFSPSNSYATYGNFNPNFGTMLLWNYTNGQGRSGYLCNGQGGPGDHEFWKCNLNQNNPITAALFASSYQTFSDHRLKEQVSDDFDSSGVYSLRPVYYYHKHKEVFEYGFIAHEVEEIFPSLVSGEKDAIDTETGRENFQALNYTALISLCIKEIQHLKREMEELKMTINK